MSLYTELKAAGVPMSNHCSDLYFKVCGHSIEILKKHKPNLCRGSTFRNQINGETWYDQPFAFDPYWQDVEEKSRLRQIK